MNQKHRNINTTKSTLSGVDVSVDKRGSTTDEERRRLRESQNVGEKTKQKVKEKNQNPRQRSNAVLLVELCGFFGQALQHAKMLTLHIVSQNNPNHYHLSTLKPCTLSTCKTNHTYPTLVRRHSGAVEEMEGSLARRNGRKRLEHTAMAAFWNRGKRVWSPEEWDEGQMDRWMANTLGQKSSFSHRKQQPSWLWGLGHTAAIEIIPP